MSKRTNSTWTLQQFPQSAVVGQGWVCCREADDICVEGLHWSRCKHWCTCWADWDFLDCIMTRNT